MPILLDKACMDWKGLHHVASRAHAEAFVSEAQRAENAADLWRQALSSWDKLLNTTDYIAVLCDRASYLGIKEGDKPEFSEAVKNHIVKSLVDFHVRRVVETLPREIVGNQTKIMPSIARYHMQIIRDIDTIMPHTASQNVKEQARRMIYEGQFQKNLLESGNVKTLQKVKHIAEIIHQLDPTPATTIYLAKVNVALYDIYQTKINSILSNDYPKYFHKIANQQTGETSNKEEYIDFDSDEGIEEDDRIIELHEQQYELIENAEEIFGHCLDRYKWKDPSEQEAISGVYYLLGWFYLFNKLYRNIDDSEFYLDEALCIDPTNQRAINLLNHQFDCENE